MLCYVVSFCLVVCWAICNTHYVLILIAAGLFAIAGAIGWNAKK